MKFYIDITNIVRIDFITGIQRVVREILIRMLENQYYEIDFVVWNAAKKKYYFVDTLSFKSFIKCNDRKYIQITNKEWDYTTELLEQEVFFDIDSVWNEDNKRCALYQILKNNNYFIYTLVYDIIPIKYPQYSHKETVYKFLYYLTGVLKYTDVILTNTENTKNDIEELLRLANVKHKKIEILPLGADFKKNKDIKKTIIREDALNAVEKGKYLLIVGTVEPRKNHKYLLDYFDQYYNKHNINLIIAGRQGWNIEKFMNRLKKHPAYKKNIFFIEKANDETIEYLYTNAFMFVFPSFYEGYGLPIIEALNHGVITAVSDINVFREIGNKYCDYISLDDVSSLGNLVSKYLNDENYFVARKKELETFKIPTWEETNMTLKKIIENNKVKELKLDNIIEQVYILTARKNGLKDTLISIDKLMPFIKKVLVQCPKALKSVIVGDYSGRLQIDIISDEELLNGRRLPDDHQERNFFLRCLAIKANILDKQFIMYDDDYVPLVQIRIDDYIENNVYKTYYFYDMRKWKGDMQNLTSYDCGVYNTYKWLIENSYPTKQYSSHMPQIINRDIFIEMINEHPEMKGVCEWSSYFNYAHTKYPNNFKALPYKTLCWPGLPEYWNLDVEPDEFLFENRYPEFYNNTGIFSKFKNNLNSIDSRVALEKICLRQKLQMKYQKNKVLCTGVNAVIKELFEKENIFYLDLRKEKASFIVPKFLCSLNDLTNKYNLNIFNEDALTEENWDFTYKFFFENADGDIVLSFSDLKIAYKLNGYEIQIKTPAIPGKYKLNIILMSKKNKLYFHEALVMIIIKD